MAILLWWVPPLPIEVNGVLKYYIVELTETETGRVRGGLVTVNTSLTVRTLHPYYHYSARVAAYTTGIGPYSDPFYVQTNESGRQSKVLLYCRLGTQFIICESVLGPCSDCTVCIIDYIYIYIICVNL